MKRNILNLDDARLHQMLSPLRKCNIGHSMEDSQISCSYERVCDITFFRFSMVVCSSLVFIMYCCKFTGIILCVAVGTVKSGTFQDEFHRDLYSYFIDADLHVLPTMIFRFWPKCAQKQYQIIDKPAVVICANIDWCCAVTNRCTMMQYYIEHWNC